MSLVVMHQLKIYKWFQLVLHRYTAQKAPANPPQYLAVQSFSELQSLSPKLLNFPVFPKSQQFKYDTGQLFILFCSIT